MLTVVVPVDAPKFSAVAAPPKFKVVATVLYKFWVVLDPTTVPGRSVKVAEVALPIAKVVAAPNALTVVAVALNTFWVVWVPTNVPV